MLKKEEFEEKVNAIGTTDDETERRNLLAELKTQLTENFETETTLSAENEKLKSDNEKLRQANMDLFLQVGSGKTEEQKIKDETGIDKEKEPEKRKFEDLFDGKGGLK